MGAGTVWNATGFGDRSGRTRAALDGLAGRLACAENGLPSYTTGGLPSYTTGSADRPRLGVVASVGTVAQMSMAPLRFIAQMST